MELENNIFGYRIAMSLADEMFQEGIISAKEYGRIDTIMAKKYNLNSCSIFRDNKPNFLDNKPI